MTPIELQDALVDEVRHILDGCLYKTPEGEDVPINVFPQNLPMNETDDENDPVPYIIVRLSDGEDAGDRESFHVTSVVMIVAVWDNTHQAQGHRDAMNIIQKIYQRFHRNPDLERKATYAGKFRWAILEDSYYPYSFAACHMQFFTAAIRREDEFA